MPFEVLIVQLAFLPFKVHDGIVVDAKAIQGVHVGGCLVAYLTFESGPLDRDPSPVMGSPVCL